MTTTLEDSPRRCPFCGARMLYEVGQHEDTGAVEAWHECWGCRYRERDDAWRDRAVHVVTDTAARRLYLLRTRG